MKLSYSQEKTVVEEKTINLPDSNSVFLQGFNGNNLPEYLGIYRNKYQSCFLVISADFIKKQYSVQGNLRLDYCKSFLESHKKVEIISKERFSSILNDFINKYRLESDSRISIVKLAKTLYPAKASGGVLNGKVKTVSILR